MTTPPLRRVHACGFAVRISDLKWAFNLCALLLCSALLSGCVSKSKANAQAHAAFLAGQQQALERMQQTRETIVTIVGPVKNSALPWTADLTLAKAVIAAEYYAPKDPSEIVIMRAGQAIRVDPSQLLGGEDIPLQPRDVVELK